MFYIPRRDLETPATKTLFEWCDQNYLQPFSYGMLVPKYRRPQGTQVVGVWRRVFDLIRVLVGIWITK